MRKVFSVSKLKIGSLGLAARRRVSEASNRASRKLGRLVSVLDLDEDFELIFLREIPDIYLMILDGEFALPFYGVYHKSLI